MKKSHPSPSVDETSAQELTVNSSSELKPQGIGMAVAFDWGLATQILITPFLPIFVRNASFFPSSKMNPALTTALSVLVSLPFAALVAVLGEGVRRGWRWARLIQLVINFLLTLVGFLSLQNLWRSSKVGNYWPLVPTTILLVFSPLIVWRLSRPTTAQWFASVTSSEARKRHGGAWLWFILMWSIIGGVLETIAGMSR